MRLFRFDDEVSTPITQFGSRFRVGPLTGDATRARVHVVHIPAHGRVGRHPSPVQRLYAVVAGHGRVSGQDGDWRPGAAP